MVVSSRTAVLAAAVPLLLIHADHLPSVALGGVDVKAADVAILAVVLAAASRAAREPGILRRAVVALPLAALCAWILVSVAIAAASDRPYETGARLVSAAGFAEYALLAVAVPVLVRTRGDLRLVLWTLAAWVGVLGAVGVVQFLGADWLTNSPPGQRQPSLIGFHDLAAAGAVALGAGLVLYLGGRGPAGLRRALLGTGAVAIVLSGSLGGGIGILLAAGFAVALAAAARVLTRRRLLVTAAIVVACLAGLVALRGGDIEQFGRFLGVLPPERTTQEDVQTYSHRTLLAYFGLRVFAEHPVAGAGWQATNEYETLRPYMTDARSRFPDVADQAFPSPEVPYGVQNGYVQALSDLGLVGLALFLAALAVPIAAAARGGIVFQEHKVLGGAVVLACAGVWIAQGLVSGIGLDALAWIGVGLVGVQLDGEPA